MMTKNIKLAFDPAVVDWLQATVKDPEGYLQSLVKTSLVNLFMSKPPDWGADILAPLDKLKPIVTVDK